MRDLTLWFKLGLIGVPAEGFFFMTSLLFWIVVSTDALPEPPYAAAMRESRFLLAAEFLFVVVYEVFMVVIPEIGGIYAF